jgi:hypothetical protein
MRLVISDVSNACCSEGSKSVPSRDSVRAIQSPFSNAAVTLRSARPRVTL